MKYYIIAGEKSGDLHASNLMKELKKQDPEAEFRCWGGDKMKDAGGTLVKHYNELAFMGLIEVLFNLRTIIRNLALCKADIAAYQPDLVILVDYAGFNLKIAKFTKEKGIKTFYYISPKIWAWNQKRAYKIKQYVDKMFVILPFEEKFYETYDYKVDFVGNPVMDAVNSFVPDPDFKKNNNITSDKIIAVLPGSRRQEIEANLKKMVELANYFPDYLFLVAAVTDFPQDFFKTQESPNLKIVYGQTYDVLHVSHAAIVTSGTATLETAMFKVPQVVCYKAHPVTYFIGINFVTIKYISLVNLLADKLVVKELLQHEFSVPNVREELTKLIGDDQYRQNQIDEYNKIEAELNKYKASKRTA
jgi:lipid-A-disaccharide synthase